MLLQCIDSVGVGWVGWWAFVGADEWHVVMQLFCDTVTEMARRQFVAGSPLRTLSLLLAGQPAEVFAAPRAQTGSPMGGTAAASDESQVLIR